MGYINKLAVIVERHKQRQTLKGMKPIFTILVITIFTTLSCSENKSGTTKTDTIEIENENTTNTKNAKLETSDTANSNNYSDKENQLTYVKDFNLFWIRDLEESANKKVGFVSLSDIYPLSEHPDSLAIPSLENVDNQNLQYFKLNSTYRKRFLSKTNISETDSAFIYDYSADELLSFPVSKLNTVAYLNTYMDVNDCPCSQSDYMIGFEVPKSNLNGLGKYFSDVLVFIGKENPFMQGQMKAIVWKKIKNEKFPIEKSNLTEVERQFKHKNTAKGQVYLYELENYQIFIQDYTEQNNLTQIQDRHLIVIDKLTTNVVNEIMFSNSEGASVAPLNFGINNTNHPDLKQQWIGKLFKDKPEVIFGFEWISFGCPSINLVNSKYRYIQINCDNRH